MCLHPPGSNRTRILVVFGTRPEAIKLAPVIEALRGHADIDLTVVATAQQADLLPAFVDAFRLAPDRTLDVMSAGQSIDELLGRLISALAPVIAAVAPRAVIVQGDTSSCLAAALVARMQNIDVVHVEAGLRSGDTDNPFPEELHRRLVSQLTSLHCAATPGNRDTLLAEGHELARIVVTGNPVVDAVKKLLATHHSGSEQLAALLRRIAAQRLLVLTAHRRESFGAYLDTCLEILRQFIEQTPDCVLVFPVHPNPAVGAAADRILAGHPRIHLIAPLDYQDFIVLCQAAWLVVSDSGGVQEEAATLGRPLLVMRAVTERPEAIDCGIARLVGPDPDNLRRELARASADRQWSDRARAIDNPFGDGHSGERIAAALCRHLETRSR